MSVTDTVRREIPDATVARLPEYLRTLIRLAGLGMTSISSEELASAAGVRPTQLRKDLSHLGSYGVRGVGYQVDTLSEQITRALGLTQNWRVLIVGMGNLGRALASYSGFVTNGFRIGGLFDEDPDLVGSVIGGVVVRPLLQLASVVGAESGGTTIGVIATPAAAAQTVCDRLVDAGVTSILNFAPGAVAVPDGVDLRRVDLATELQILAFHAQRRNESLSGPAAATMAVAP